METKRRIKEKTEQVVELSNSVAIGIVIEEIKRLKRELSELKKEFYREFLDLTYSVREKRNV